MHNGGGSAWSIATGMHMISVAELDERIDKCLAILAQNPHSRVFAALADAYRKRGDFGKAFSICKGGLKHHPDYAPAHVVMAKLYLHQHMFGDALESIQHAVRADNPTRATDLLEAEIRIAMGDIDGASPIVARLKVGDPHNDQVREVAAKLRTTQTHGTLPSADTARQFVTSTVPEASGSVSGQDRPSFARTESPISWDEWEAMVETVPQVATAFAWDADGDPLAGVSDQPTARSTGTIIANLFSAIDELLRLKIDASLEEIRVERSNGELWCGRGNRGLIGFAGHPGVSFGAARQAAVANARRVSGGSAH